MVVGPGNAGGSREPPPWQRQMAVLVLPYGKGAAPATAFSSPDLRPPASILQLQASSFAELGDAVRSGLPFCSFLALKKQLEISPQQFTAVFGIPPRTIARRREARDLNPQESDRLDQVASALSLADELPLDLLGSEIGARQVEEVLLHLNYGIFS